jgi:hypothetical protein
MTIESMGAPDKRSPAPAGVPWRERSDSHVPDTQPLPLSGAPQDLSAGGQVQD